MNKKIISMFLSVVMFICLIPGIAAHASVIGDDYPDEYKAAEINEYGDRWNFLVRQCTSFAAYRLDSVNGVDFHNYYGGVHWGHANNWYLAAKKLGIRVDKTPAVGSIAYSTSGEHGHVAWVAEVDAKNGNVTIEEYNYKYAGAYSKRTVKSSSFSGYIHIKDLDSTSAAPVISDGTYILEAAYDGMCLGISDNRNSKWGNCELRRSDNKSLYAVNIKKLDSGYYSIQNSMTRLYLDDALSGRANGTNLQFVEWNASNAQQYRFSSVGNNYVTISCRANGLLVDVSGGRSDEYTNIQMYQSNSSTAQKWKLTPYIPSSEKPHKHVYADKITIKEASCVAEGEAICICSCGDFISEKIPAKGHDFSNKITVDRAATCTANGETSYHCKKCNERTGIKELPCKGHDLITIYDGSGSYDICAECGYSSKEPIVTNYVGYNSASTYWNSSNVDNGRINDRCIAEPD